MFGIVKNFISGDYINLILDEINLSYDKVEIDGNIIDEERATCWMSDFNYLYKYGNKIMEPLPLSSNIKKIQNIIHTNYGEYFDSVLINYYKDGNVGMRYHSDEVYDEWYDKTVIVSFGTDRKLVFRLINNYDDKTYFNFSNGDLIYMNEGCQSLYQHRLLKNKNIKKDRISLVFKKHK